MTQLFTKPKFKHERQVLLDHLKHADKDVSFGQIPTELFDDSQATPLDKIIYGRLHTFCFSKQLSECPTCAVAINTICEKINRTESVVRKSLRRLNNLGWILITRRGGTLPNEYTLFPHNKKRVRKLKKDLKSMENIKRELSMGRSERFERIKKQVAASQSHRQYEKYTLPEIKVEDIPLNHTFYKFSPEEIDKLEEMKKNWSKKDKNLHTGFLDKKRKNKANMEKIWA